MIKKCLFCKWHTYGEYWISECCNFACANYGDYCTEQNDGNECEYKVEDE